MPRPDYRTRYETRTPDAPKVMPGVSRANRTRYSNCRYVIRPNQLKPSCKNSSSPSS